MDHCSWKRHLSAALLCFTPQSMVHLTGAPPPTSHLSLVPTILEQTLQRGDLAVDCTAGNGYDTVCLARLCREGHVVAMDVQQEALDATRLRLLQDDQVDLRRVTFFHGNHKDLSAVDATSSSSYSSSCSSSDTENGSGGGAVKAFVYNLGYLPGSDRSVRTVAEDTLISLRGARDRTARGGIVCVTCYRGHDGGAEELAAVRDEMSSWDQCEFRVVEHRPLNWPRSPVLLTAHRFEMPRKKLPKRNDPV
jgi:SAM-dependent methyltransferase